MRKKFNIDNNKKYARYNFVNSLNFTDTKMFMMFYDTYYSDVSLKKYFDKMKADKPRV